MAGLATKETDRSVQNFINGIGNASKEADSQTILQLIEEITGYKPKVWGNANNPDFLIGFGNYTYNRKGSKETLEWFNIGFAARKTKLTIYLTFDINEEKALIHQLGKCKWGKGCLYINKLDDIDLDILGQIIEKGKNSRWQ